MDYQKNLLKQLVHEIVCKQIDLNGLDDSFDLSAVDDNDLLDLAICVSRCERDYVDMFAEDIYHEIANMTFALISHKKDDSQYYEIRAEFAKRLISFYKK